MTGVGLIGTDRMDQPHLFSTAILRYRTGYEFSLLIGSNKDQILERLAISRLNVSRTWISTWNIHLDILVGA